MESEQWTEDSIKCFICLNYLTDPTTLPCGHNFCMNCIEGSWDMEIYSATYSCPQCKRTMRTRPELTRNSMLAVMVNKLKGTSEHQTGSNVKRVKTFLESHGSVYPKPQLRQKLLKATGNPQDLICPLHEKTLGLYCRDDKECICEICKYNEHRGHETVLVNEERDIKQVVIEDIQRENTTRLQEQDKHLQKLKDTRESFQRSAESAVKDTDKILNDLTKSIEKMGRKMKENIRGKERTLVSQLESEEQKVEQRISTLRKKDKDLMALSNEQENILFLQKWQSITSVKDDQPPSTTIIAIAESFSFDTLLKAATDIKDLLENMNGFGSVDQWDKGTANAPNAPGGNIIQREMQKQPPHQKLHRTVSECPPVRPKVEIRRVDRPDKPLTRADFLKYACPLSLDPETAHSNLHFSDENRKVKCQPKMAKKYKNVRQRFDKWEQVLCREGLRGSRCYWEVEWTGRSVYIGMALESICRKGNGFESGLGFNPKSWSLHCCDSNMWAWHNNVETKIAVHVWSPRIGVCLDSCAGTLSFYSVSGEISWLYTFDMESFSEPIYPAFRITEGSSIKLCMM